MLVYMNNQITSEKTIKIPIRKYNLLQEMFKQVKKQALLFRVLEAEENLEKKNVKEVKIDEFIKRI